MARNLLTSLEIKARKKRKLRDGDGLWLHDSKGGSQYWVFIFIRNGRRREMGLGPYGAGTGQVSLAAARVKAEEIRTIIGSGGDPFVLMKERQITIKERTFGELADDYIEAMKPQWRGAKTEAGWRNTMTVHAKPIRKISISELKTDDVVQCLKPIWQTKTETATKVRERIKMVLDHAKALGLRSGDNPAEWRGHLDQILATPKTLQKGHHAALPFSDMASFLNKLKLSAGTSARALEFVILTAARSGEARGATWSEIDLENRIWIIPAERMKSAREHRVPLSSASISVLSVMRNRRISDFVFPGAKEKSALSDMSLSKALKTAGAGEFTVHGFRSTFREWVSETTDFPSEIAEAALAHVTGDTVERAYRRGDVFDKRRSLMAAWGDYCMGQGNGI